MSFLACPLLYNHLKLMLLMYITELLSELKGWLFLLVHYVTTMFQPMPVLRERALPTEFQSHSRQ